MSTFNTSQSKVQTAAKYVSDYIMFQFLAAGTKHLLPSKFMELFDNQVTNQSVFNSCRKDLIQDLGKIFNKKYIHQSNGICAAFADMGLTYGYKPAYLNSIITPLARAKESPYRAHEIDGTINSLAADRYLLRGEICVK